MLDKAVRCLKHKLSQEKTFLSLFGDRERKVKQTITEIEQAITILKANVPEKLQEIIEKYLSTSRPIEKWADTADDLLFDIEELNKKIKETKC